MFSHIERWWSSGLSQRDYCRKVRFNHSGFYYGLTRFKEQIDCEPAPAYFIPVLVHLPEETMVDRFIVTGPNGMEILFLCTQQSIALIRQLVMGGASCTTPIVRSIVKLAYSKGCVDLSESTLGDLFTQVAKQLTPVYEAHRQEMMASGYLNVDERRSPHRFRGK